MNSRRNTDRLQGSLSSARGSMSAGPRQVQLNRRPRLESSQGRRPHCWVVGSQLLVLVFFCSCSSTRESLQLDMTAQKIVLRHAEAAFEVAFDATASKDRGALSQYEGKVESARSRADLEEAWVEIPDLKAHGADFLQKQIFDRAARDGDWPSGAPPADEKVVYVDAVRTAIDVFLNEGTEDNP